MESTDQEIFDQAVAEQTENTPETPVEAPVEAKSERARDEKGRYVSAIPEPTSQEAPVEAVAVEHPQVEKEDARVPSWRLAEEADRRRAAEQSLNELRNEMRQWQMQMMHMQQPQQAPQEAPDIFADPNAFVQMLQDGWTRQRQQDRLESSLRFAGLKHGEQQFNDAYQAFTDYVSRSRDNATYQRVMASADPGDALVQWHKEQSLHQELGGSDLKSFLDKQKEEWLKDPTVQAKVIEAFKATQQAQPTNNLNLPPSLSKAAAARSAHDEGGSSGADIYAYATKR